MSFFGNGLFIELLVSGSEFDIRGLWSRLTKVGALAGDVTLTEFTSVFELIQSDFARSGSCSALCRWHGDTEGLRQALRRLRYADLRRMSDSEVERAVLNEIRLGKLVVRPEDRQIADRVHMERAKRAAARYWASRPAPVVKRERPRRIPSETVTPSQLKRLREAEQVVHDKVKPEIPAKVSAAGFQFIYEHEAQAGRSNRLHWPGGASGVTLGPGYDMRSKTPDQIRRTMNEIGVDPDTTQRLMQASKLSGKQADEFVRAHVNLVALTRSQEEVLLRKTLPEYESIARNRLKVNVEQHEFDALVSLTYNATGASADVFREVNAGNASGVVEEMRKINTSKGAKEVSLGPRREDEIRLYSEGRYEKFGKPLVYPAK